MLPANQPVFVIYHSITDEFFAAMPRLVCEIEYGVSAAVVSAAHGYLLIILVAPSYFVTPVALTYAP